MNKIQTYKKYDENENIEVGDLISIVPNTELVTRSYTKHYKKQDKLTVGVCTAIYDKTIDVAFDGVVDVNVTGLICIGDRITTSGIFGKAKAIKYVNDDIRIFDIRGIGKIIGLYNDYSKAKVLLDIE